MSSAAGTTDSLDLDVVPETDPVIDLLHCCARRLVRPCGALAACAVRGEVVELDAVRTGQVALCLRRELKQIHAHGLAREIAVAVHFEGPVAVCDHLTAPHHLHG